MKKIILSVAIVMLALGSLTSCGGNAAAKEGKDEGLVIKEKIENCTDPDSLKIYVQQAQEYASSLEAKGDGEAAKAYIDEVAPVIDKKDPEAASFFRKLKDAAQEEIAEIDSTAKAKAEELREKGGEAVDAVKDEASDVYEKGKGAVTDAAKKTSDKAGDIYEAGKEKTKETVEKGKEKTKEAVEKGKEKTKEAVEKGKEKLKKIF